LNAQPATSTLSIISIPFILSPIQPKSVSP
jgi:hypothetical protein